MNDLGPNNTAKLAALEAAVEEPQKRIDDLNALLRKRQAEHAAAVEASSNVSLHADPKEIAELRILQNARLEVIGKIEAEIDTVEKERQWRENQLTIFRGHISGLLGQVAEVNQVIASREEYRDTLLAQLAQ